MSMVFRSCLWCNDYWGGGGGGGVNKGGGRPPLLNYWGPFLIYLEARACFPAMRYIGRGSPRSMLRYVIL